MIVLATPDCNGRGCEDPAHPRPEAERPGACPTCGGGPLTLWGSYRRHLVYVTGRWHGPSSVEVHEEVVAVARVRCASCGRTHALLWRGLVAYSPFSVRALALACVALRRCPPASEAASALHAAVVTCRRAWADAARLAEALSCALEALPEAIAEASRSAASVAGLCARFESLHGTTPFSRVALAGHGPPTGHGAPGAHVLA